MSDAPSDRRDPLPAADGVRPPEEELEARLDRLERMVAMLMREQLAAARAAARAPDPEGVLEEAPGLPTAREEVHASAPSFAPPPPPEPPPARPASAWTLTDWARLGDVWLGRVGIGLLILGLAFGFKYAVDQGWITPWLRVAFGLQLGAVMLIVGLHLARSRRLYGQLLLGGALAVFYMTGWAAWELYGLVSYAVAISYMSAVTVLSLALAERQDQEALAVVGAMVGLATPFLVAPSDASVAGLVVYATLVLSWSAWLQFRHGWRGLQVVVACGGFLVMGMAVALAASPGHGGADDWVAQAGLLVAWTAAVALPFLRRPLHLAAPERWPAPASRLLRGLGETTKPVGARLSDADLEARGLRGYLLVMGVVGSGAAALLAVPLWNLDRVGTGVAFQLAAILMAALAWATWRERGVAAPAAESAALLLAGGTALVVPAEWIYLPLAVQGALFLLARREWELPGLAVVAHVVFVGLLVGFMSHLQMLATWDQPAFRGPSVLLLVAIGVAAACSLIIRDVRTSRAYLLGAHAGLLLWLGKELTPLPKGIEITSLAWGLYGSLLLTLGIRARNVGLRVLAFATLALVVAKLLLVDMALMDRVWRILVFMGFGGAFLVLSYFLQEENEEAAPGGASSVGEAAGGAAGVATRSGGR